MAATASALAADEPAREFGKDVELAPVVVQGKPISVSIHGRTKADRKYGEKFANEVVEIAYETLGDSTGRGLVIVGAEGEPHPVLLLRKFVTMAKDGRLNPNMARDAAVVEKALQKMQAKFKTDDTGAQKMGITFETFLPALPMGLTGAVGQLYLLAWTEGFNDQRIEERLKVVTPADLVVNEFKRYDWVFYVPPHSTTGPVIDELTEKAMKAEKMGPVKRTLAKTLLLAFRPVINKGVEAMRSGFLFETILRADGRYSDADINELTRAYVRELMPDLKPGSGDEKKRALAAIEKQKIANAEYAKDPFVTPARLATFEPSAYDACLGEYRQTEPRKVTYVFKREGSSFVWSDKDHDRDRRVFYPAGERLLVDEAGRITLRFLVDETGKVTGVEQRLVRQRRTIPRK